MSQLVLSILVASALMGLSYLAAMRFKDRYDSKGVHVPAKNVLLVIAHPDDETV